MLYVYILSPKCILLPPMTAWEYHSSSSWLMLRRHMSELDAARSTSERQASSTLSYTPSTFHLPVWHLSRRRYFTLEFMEDTQRWLLSQSSFWLVLSRAGNLGGGFLRRPIRQRRYGIHASWSSLVFGCGGGIRKATWERESLPFFHSYSWTVLLCLDVYHVAAICTNAQLPVLLYSDIFCCITLQMTNSTALPAWLLSLDMNNNNTKKKKNVFTKWFVFWSFERCITCLSVLDSCW